jgi:hypothetical protein
MLSDETISNIRLHRDTRADPNAPPFVVPMGSGPQVPTVKPTAPRNVKIRLSKAAMEAKTRAVSDSCMAASVGDLQWLKQSIRDGPIGRGEGVTVEETYGSEVRLDEAQLGAMPVFVSRVSLPFISQHYTVD